MCKAILLYQIYTCTEKRLKREASQLHFVIKVFRRPIFTCTGITQMFVQVASVTIVRKEFHHRKNLRHSWKVSWTEYSIRYYSSIIEVWKDVAQLQIKYTCGIWLIDRLAAKCALPLQCGSTLHAHLESRLHSEHVCSGDVHMWKGTAQCTCSVYRVQTRACGKPAHSRRVTLVYSINDARMNILRTMGWVVYSEVVLMWKVVAHWWTLVQARGCAWKSVTQLVCMRAVYFTWVGW